MPVKFKLDPQGSKPDPGGHNQAKLDELVKMRRQLGKPQRAYREAVMRVRKVRDQIEELEARKSSGTSIGEKGLTEIDEQISDLKTKESAAIELVRSSSVNLVQAENAAAVDWATQLRENGYDISLTEAKSFIKVDATIGTVFAANSLYGPSARSDSEMLNEMSDLFEFMPTARPSSLLKAITVQRLFSAPTSTTSLALKKAQRLGVEGIWNGTIDDEFVELCDGLLTETPPVLQEGKTNFTRSELPLKKGFAKAALVNELRNNKAQALEVVRQRANNPEAYSEFMQNVVETSNQKLKEFFPPEGERSGMTERMLDELSKKTEVALDKMLNEEVVPAIERYVLQIEAPEVPERSGASGFDDPELTDGVDISYDGESREAFEEDYHGVEASTVGELFR